MDTESISINSEKALQNGSNNEKRVFEFRDAVHKQAVSFRNRKREEYLNGFLKEEHKSFVEDWDIKKENNKISWRIRSLREEPKSQDVFLKVFLEGSR
jgi:hypothetical protein